MPACARPAATIFIRQIANHNNPTKPPSKTSQLTRTHARATLREEGAHHHRDQSGIQVRVLGRPDVGDLV